VKEGSIRGIIGIVNVTGLNFLAVITDAVVVGELNNVNIWRVSKVRFLAFKEGHLSTECVKLLDASKIMLEDGFYFSYGYDVTASRQRRLKWLKQGDKDPLKLIACDQNYFWNYALY
jgi:hypothetical protein